MLSANYISSLVFGLATLQTASAIPAPEKVPEVIPGPGLPSLESLGLTSADLYAMPKPEFKDGDMSVQFDAFCGPNDTYYTNVNDAIACFHYLNNLGTQTCRVRSGGRDEIFCTAGVAKITGYGIEQSGYCRDVACAVLWTIDHCTRPQQDVAGWQATCGNGDFPIAVAHI